MASNAAPPNTKPIKAPLVIAPFASCAEVSNAPPQQSPTNEVSLLAVMEDGNPGTWQTRPPRLCMLLILNISRGYEPAKGQVFQVVISVRKRVPRTFRRYDVSRLNAVKLRRHEEGPHGA